MSTTKTDPKSKLPVPFRPNGSQILVKLFDVEEKSAGGRLVLPQAESLNYASSQTVRGEVMAVGKDNTNCKVGDIIMLHPLVGNMIYLAGEPFRVIRSEDFVGFYE